MAPGGGEVWHMGWWMMGDEFQRGCVRTRMWGGGVAGCVGG